MRHATEKHVEALFAVAQSTWPPAPAAFALADLVSAGLIVAPARAGSRAVKPPDYELTRRGREFVDRVVAELRQVAP